MEMTSQSSMTGVVAGFDEGLCPQSLLFPLVFFHIVYTLTDRLKQLLKQYNFDGKVLKLVFSSTTYHLQRR